MARRKDQLTSHAILASLSPEETLDYLQRNGMIDVDDVKEKIVDKERKQKYRMAMSLKMSLKNVFVGSGYNGHGRIKVIKELAIVSINL